MKIGVVANRTKPGAANVLRQLLRLADDHGVRVFLEKETARLLKAKKGHPFRVLVKKIDLLIVVGGDGSLLRVVHAIYPSQVPIFGINLGHLGFLTAARYDELDQVLPEVFRSKLRTSARLPLQLTIKTKLGRRVIPCALNDIVFNRSSSSMALIRVKSDNLCVNEYVADGLIVSTPTGSTAYSLAAGGPILSPEAKGLLLTPICPHTLSTRSLIVAGSTVLRIEAPPQARRIDIQFDGVTAGSLNPGDWAEIRTAESSVNLAFLKRRDFFKILREKLRWSGAAIGELPKG